MPTLKFSYYEESGDCDEVIVDLPAKWEICARCEGEGKHVNPNIDGHGITAEEWERDWDEDEREGYFTGRYDVGCMDCSSSGKVLTYNFDCINDDMKQRILNDQADRSFSNYEDAYTRRMESGGYDY